MSDEEKNNQEEKNGQEEKNVQSQKRPLIKNFREFLTLCGVAVFIAGVVMAVFFDGAIKEWGFALLGLAAIFVVLSPPVKKKKGIKRIFYLIGAVLSGITIGLYITGLVAHIDGLKYIGIAALIVSVIFLLLSGENVQLF
ncbi:MAG: hypothetical protein LBT30_00455 [Clostridiales bacterium]|nr:hypothetical protein [Clostridiales bacterium]